MRVLITADLHYRPAERDAYLAFAERALALAPDCFIIAGDIGHPLRLFRRALQLFRDLPCPRLIVAGNHDLYRGEHDSRTLWQTCLPQVAHEEGYRWLDQQNHVLGALGICGTMGWYDYSTRAPHLPYHEDEYRELKRAVSYDADYIDWPWSDRAMARYLARSFAARLGALEADPAVRHILVVTHMPIFADLIPHHPEWRTWSLLRAYLGNLPLGRLVRGHRKVTHVVSGHLHRPGRWSIPGDHGDITCHIVGTGAGHPHALLLEL